MYVSPPLQNKPKEKECSLKGNGADKIFIYLHLV